MPGKLAPAIIVAASLLAALVLGCAEGSDEHEAGVVDIMALSGNRFMTVDRFGAREALSFTGYAAGVGDEDPPVYVDFCLTRGGGLFHAITSDFAITLVDLELGAEVKLFQAAIPGGEGLYESRLGYAGRRVYILSDTELHGKALSFVDLVELEEELIVERMEDLGPGYERPVSFDLARGGHQAWVLFESGKLYAFNIFYEEEPEGEIADLGPGFKDVNAGLGGNIYAAGEPGLYRIVPGGEPVAIGDVTGIAAIRLGDMAETGVFMATVSNEIKATQIETGFSKSFSTLSDPVLAIESLHEPWVKNTKPIIRDPAAAPSYPAGVVVPYFIFFDDPEGEKAAITVTLATDPGQGAYFVENNGASVNITDAVPGNGNNASFYSGGQAGTVDILIEALSADGQLATRRDSIVIQ